MNRESIFFRVRKHLFWRLNSAGAFDRVPDEKFLKIAYRCRLGEKLDLENPKTFNGKLQWLKLHNRKPEYSSMVDKYEVKEYVKKVIGEEYIIPTIGIWDRFEDIDFDSLPNKFVLKCTHDSGGVVICKDKQTLDITKAKSIINASMKRNYYLSGREWPYKNVKPRIIAEEYISDVNGELNDFKFFCFGGKTEFFKIDFDRFTNHRANYYDMQMNLLPFGEVHYPHDPKREFSKPKAFEQMVQFAEKLAGSLPFLRVDFYNINGKIYFGELTFYPMSGFGPWEPDDSWDEKLGNLISLPKKT